MTKRPLYTTDGSLLHLVLPRCLLSGELRAYTAVPTAMGELKLLYRYPIGSRSVCSAYNQSQAARKRRANLYVSLACDRSKFVPPVTDGKTIYLGQVSGCSVGLEWSEEKVAQRVVVMRPSGVSAEAVG